MSSDTIIALSQSILRLTARLERLPLPGIVAPAFVSLADDPGALLDELLAPLVEGSAPPFVEDANARSTDSSQEPQLRQFPRSHTPQVGARQQASVSRAAWQPRPRSIWHGDNNGYQQPQPDAALPTSTRQERTPWDTRPGQERRPPPDQIGSQHAQQVSDPIQHGQPSSTGSRSPGADWASPTAGNQANTPNTAFERHGIRPRHAPSLGSLATSRATSHATNTDGEQFDTRPPASEPFPAAGAEGMRLAHGIAGLSALLKANTDRHEQLGAQPNVLQHPVQPTDSYQNYLDARDQPSIPSSAAMFDRAAPAQDGLFISSADINAPRYDPPDMDAIMRELEDRLEFEYLRMYGTTGD